LITRHPRHGGVQHYSVVRLRQCYDVERIECLREPDLAACFGRDELIGGVEDRFSVVLDPDSAFAEVGLLHVYDCPVRPGPNVEEEVAVFADDVDERGYDPRCIHVAVGGSCSIIAIRERVHTKIRLLSVIKLDAIDNTLDQGRI
jgi:hypothetical protein